MVAQPETFAAGVPVEIGKIDRELKKIWAEGGGRHHPRIAHQPRDLQRSARLTRAKHGNYFQDHRKPRLPRHCGGRESIGE